MAAHAQRAHALLSASGAYRWMVCTPSARLEENMPDKDSDFSKEGTLAHELAELDIRHHVKPIPDYAQKRNALQQSKYYKLEMEDPIAVYVDYVLSNVDEGDLLIVEQKLDLTHIIPEGFGSNDAIILKPHVLKVLDLKFGKGVRVSAEENPQLMLYGLGALQEFELSYDIDTVELVIVQPRLDAVSTWQISAEDLKHWGETVVKEKAALAHEGKGDFVAGDHCKFCKVKARCRALEAEMNKIAAMDFQDPLLLTDKELLEVYKKGDLVSDWISSVQNHVLQEALKGKKWPGYKLVEGRSVRVWKDEGEAAETLLLQGYSRDQVFNMKIKGITEVEKTVGKKNYSVIADFILKPPGKPTLVEDTDKREALDPNDSAKKDFS